VALFWGPLGWATRAAAGATGIVVWRWASPSIPLDASAQWALQRFDHVVVGDHVSADLARAAGAAAVSIIGRASTVTSESGNTSRSTPTIGWLSEDRGHAPFELFLLLRRLRSGAIGVCSRCQAPRAGKFDPWQSSVRPPTCCGDIQLLSPIDAQAQFAGPASPHLSQHCDRIIEWLRLEDVASVELASPTDLYRIPAVVGDWSLQVSFDEHPELPWSVVASALSGVPCVTHRFGSVADLDNPSSVRTRTRLSRGGAVRGSPDPANAAVRVHQLLSDPTFYKRSAQALRPIAAAHSPDRVDRLWKILVEQLAPQTSKLG
jgi:hypothetical protein